MMAKGKKNNIDTAIDENVSVDNVNSIISGDVSVDNIDTIVDEDVSVDSIPNDVFEQMDTPVDSTPNDVSEQINIPKIDTLNEEIKKINSDTVEKNEPITRSIFNRGPFVEKIYIEGTTLIKEREYKDGRKEFFYKELFDYNVLSAIRFGRSLANDIHSYEKARDRLYNRPKKF